MRATPPPSVRVYVNDHDDEPVRRDWVSDDVKRVHPEVRPDWTLEQRNAHARMCDWQAYQSIRARFPRLLPPSWRDWGDDRRLTDATLRTKAAPTQ